MSSPIGKGPFAIIADDEDIGRLLLENAAIAAGLTALSFDNGVDALAAALANEVALVLLDVEMPGMNGFDVCARIRIAKRASLPIVIVTGLDDQKAVARAFEAGATDFVSKPVNWSLLPHRLAYILRNADREAKIVTLLEAIPDALWVVSPRGELRWSQKDTRSSNEPKPSEGISGSLIAAVPGDRLADVLLAIELTARDGDGRTLDVQYVTAQDKHCSSELRFSRCEGGDVLVVRQDTSERTAAARHIERLAFYDALTGLPNRQHCISVAAQYLDHARIASEQVAFIYLDLNSFKRVNDTFGHSVGDIVLQKVAAALVSLLQSSVSKDVQVLLARLGGDEFVVILRHTYAKKLALDAAKSIRAALEKPIAHGTLEFHAAPSIGIATYPDDGTDVESLLKHADTAMYQAKSNGGSEVVAYTASMSARIRDALDLETRLRRALRDNALDVRFQPKYRLVDGNIVGAEALLRWFDSDLGEISPSRFIPIAEESGLIVDIGAWVVRTVCDRLRLWHIAGLAIPIAVNVSGKELLFADPARVIKQEAQRAEIPTSLIEAEITESVFVTDSMAGRESVERIRQLGCRIALDDFGTGYSSLSYLSRFPPDRLKIDRSFVQNMDRSSSDAAIVKAILSLAKSLRLLVTAEGIERPAQLQWLKNNGCDEGQGYLLSRPVTATELETLFRRQSQEPLSATAASTRSYFRNQM